MGLGGYPKVSLADARKARDAAEQLVVQGVDPIAAKYQAKAELPKAKPTFGEIADLYIKSRQAQWRNDKHRAQWSMTLKKYAAPIRPKPVDEIDTAAILEVLNPFWQTKPETAARLRGRIEAVLDAALALGHTPRHEANPARWRGHLDKLLPKRSKLSQGHHAAMPYVDVPGFIGRLREREAMSAIMLEFTILTAARSGEVIWAAWDEINFPPKFGPCPPSG